MTTERNTTVYPLLWSKDVKVLLDWTRDALGLAEVWRSTAESGAVEHAEVSWHGGIISLNELGESGGGMGPGGISLRAEDRAEVDAIHERAVAAGATIRLPPADSFVAYSFTAVDPDGNQWWVNVETGPLDELRKTGGA